MPPTPSLALISWSGMRGGVSLAAALAIPLTTDAGEPFPGRNLILFLTFAVIFGTLVVQGLTLPAAIRLLRLEDDGEDDGARAGAGPHPRGGGGARCGSTSSRPRTGCATTPRSESAAATTSGRTASPPGSTAATTARSRRARSTSSGCAASCSTPSGRRCTSCGARGEISDEVARRVERDLDLEDARLEI